jgi:hypothetical protein
VPASDRLSSSYKSVGIDAGVKAETHSRTDACTEQETALAPTAEPTLEQTKKLAPRTEQKGAFASSDF